MEFGRETLKDSENAFLKWYLRLRKTKHVNSKPLGHLSHSETSMITAMETLKNDGSGKEDSGMKKEGSKKKRM